MRTPAFADALVTGLSASPSTANEILGDLAEEWQAHVEQDGHAAAKRWYWGQAFRAIPHLLQQWWLQSNWTAIVVVLAAAVVARLLLAFAGAGATHALLRSGGEWQPLHPDPHWITWVMMPVLLATAAFTNVAVGASIAAVVRRAPMVVVAWTWH
jgi:hypothetical protein